MPGPRPAGRRRSRVARDPDGGRRALMSGRLPRRAVVGAGAWGTTLAVLLSRTGPVTLLVRDQEQVDRLQFDGRNERRLPGVPLGPDVVVSVDAADLSSATELVVLAVPSAVLRSRLRAVAASLPGEAVLLSVVKGLEGGTLLRMSQVIAEEVPKQRRSRGGSLRAQPGAGDRAWAAGCGGRRRVGRCGQRTGRGDPRQPDLPALPQPGPGRRGAGRRAQEHRGHRGRSRGRSLGPATTPRPPSRRAAWRR